jgi:hypothetical protein
MEWLRCGLGDTRLLSAVRAGVVALTLSVDAGDGWAAARTWDRLARPSQRGMKGLPSPKAPLPLWPTYDWFTPINHPGYGRHLSPQAG